MKWCHLTYIASESQLSLKISLEKSVFRWSKGTPSDRKVRLAVEIEEVCKASADHRCRPDRTTG